MSERETIEDSLEQWGNVEHDMCWRCTKLGYQRGERIPDGTWEYVPIGPGELPLLSPDTRRWRFDDQ